MGCGSSKEATIVTNRNNKHEIFEDNEAHTEHADKLEMNEEYESRGGGGYDTTKVKAEHSSIKKKKKKFNKMKKGDIENFENVSHTLGKYSSSRRLIFYKETFNEHYSKPRVETVKAIKYNEDVPNLLFYFEWKKKKFHYCNLDINDHLEWLSKSLPEQDHLPFFKRNYYLSQMELYSYCLVSSESLMIVGGYNPLYSSIEYNFKKNEFVKKSFDIEARAKPSLISFEGVLCSLSGNKGDDYCCDFDLFDLNKDKWIKMPPITTPHYAGCCYSFKKKGEEPIKGQHINRDLFIAGGFTTPNKVNNYNATIDYFNFGTFKWKSWKMEEIFNITRVPRITDCSSVQTDEGQILFLNEKRTGSCYLNTGNKTLKKYGKIKPGEIFNKKGMPLHAVHFNGTIYMLSHTETGEEEKKVVMHIGDLSTKEWTTENTVLV